MARTLISAELQAGRGEHLGPPPGTAAKAPRKQFRGKGGKGLGKIPRKVPPTIVKKPRNVRPYKDKWAQIKYAYITENIPMPESYYKKQKEWFEKNTEGQTQKDYLDKLKKHYKDNKHRLDAQGRVPGGKTRRVIEKAKKAREEAGEQEEEEQQQSENEQEEEEKQEEEQLSERMKSIVWKLGFYGNSIERNEPIPEDEMTYIIANADTLNLMDDDIQELKRYQREHSQESSPKPKRPRKWDVQTRKYFDMAYHGNDRLHRILTKAMRENDEMRTTLGNLENMVFH